MALNDEDLRDSAILSLVDDICYDVVSTMPHLNSHLEGDNENAVAKPSVRMREEKLNLRMCFSDGSRDAQHAVFSPIGNLC